MLFKRIVFFILLFWNTLLFGQNVFFNEIDHINPDLCVELAVDPDVDLTNWSVVTYDNTGLATDTIPLTGVPPTSITPSGFYIIEVDVVFLHPSNGGISIINNNNNPIQFISYGGSITAVDGPATGQTSENIGTQTATGNSQQLQGVGSEYTDFDWGIPGDASCGFENDNQTLLLPEAPLSVELLYFEGHKRDTYIELFWATISEQNNEYFIIEKSIDGQSFIEIDRINGAGNSNIEIQYSYQDFEFTSRKVYYRLIDIDYNGSKNYSDIIAFTIDHQEQDIRIFPNPVSDQLQILIPSSSDKTVLTLYNILGEQILHKTFADLPNELIEIEMVDLPTGSYLLLIQSGDLQYQEKIIKRF